MILAGRKIQAVHQSLADDLTDTREIRERLEEVAPKIDRVQSLLGSTEEHLGRFESLARSAAESASHNEAVDERLTRIAGELERLVEQRAVEASRQRSDEEAHVELEELRTQKDDACERAEAAEAEAREARKALAALSRRYEEEMTELDRQRAEETQRERERREAVEEKLATLEADARAAFLRENEQSRRREDLERIEGQLEARVEELQALVQDLLSGDAEELAADPGDREQDREALGAIEERLRLSELARLEVEARHTKEMTDFADHTHRRLAELEHDLRRERSVAAEWKERAEELELECADLEERAREHEVPEPMPELPRGPSGDRLADLMAHDERPSDSEESSETR